MKEKIIKAYVNRLTKNDIIMFAKKKNVSLNNNEVDFIYNNIKKNYENILDNPLKYLELAKANVNSSAYNIIYELYTTYYPKL